jgi:hypothetical protein
MTTFKTPAADAPGSEWGRLAVTIPDWRWMEAMQGVWTDGRGNVHRPRIERCAGQWVEKSSAGIDPDDPATAGCLLALLGPYVSHMECRVRPSGEVVWRQRADAGRLVVTGWLPLGRVCIAYAAALGRWPGGAS